MFKFHIELGCLCPTMHHVWPLSQQPLAGIHRNFMGNSNTNSRCVCYQFVHNQTFLSQLQYFDMLQLSQGVFISLNVLHIKFFQVVIHYLLNYPLGKKITKHIEFYISQLSYEMENGRESALEIMVTLILTSFPQVSVFIVQGSR